MAKPPENQTNNLWDALFGEIGRAVTDIREKVVLEPWFGPTADHGANPATHNVAEELGWVKSDREMPAPDHDHGADLER